MIHASFYLNAVWGLLHIIAIPKFKTAWGQILDGVIGAALLAFALAGLLNT